MKKATLVIWVIIFGFIALVIFQNKTFFLDKQALHLNLGLLEPYHSPELSNAIIVLLFFFAGLAVAYLFGLSSRFKAKRTIKRLNATIADHSEELTKLKSEINTLKGIEPPVEPPAGDQADTVKIDMDTTQKIADEDAGDKTIKYVPDDNLSNPDEDTEEKAEEKVQ
ncbi:MAG: lipopolysaccharide assembly protein LapA domain-containing protein [Desulfobacterales bacterium]